MVGWLCKGRKTCASSSGPSLHAQPLPCENEVNFSAILTSFPDGQSGTHPTPSIPPLIAMIINMWEHPIMHPVVECCAPISREILAADQAAQLAAWYRVLGDPVRLRLLSLIASMGEACAACDLVEPIGVSQPTVSHHLKVLYQAGLVDREKRGRWVYYRVVPERLAVLSKAIAG